MLLCQLKSRVEIQGSHMDLVHLDNGFNLPTIVLWDKLRVVLI